MNEFVTESGGEFQADSDDRTGLAMACPTA